MNGYTPCDRSRLGLGHGFGEREDMAVERNTGMIEEGNHSHCILTTTSTYIVIHT